MGGLYIFGYNDSVFSRKRGAGTDKRGKDKHTDNFPKISLYNISVYLHLD